MNNYAEHVDNKCKVFRFVRSFRPFWLRWTTRRSRGDILVSVFRSRPTVLPTVPSRLEPTSHSVFCLLDATQRRGFPPRGRTGISRDSLSPLAEPTFASWAAKSLLQRAFKLLRLHERLKHNGAFQCCKCIAAVLTLIPRFLSSFAKHL